MFKKKEATTLQVGDRVIIDLKKYVTFKLIRCKKETKLP
jgi:hypothetical protein